MDDKKKAEELDQKLQETGKKFEAAGEKMEKVGKTLTIWITLPIVGAVFFGIPGLVIGLIIAIIIG